MSLNILSIDWDYFFPNSTIFDWGFNDNYCDNVKDLVWLTRPYNTAFLSEKYIAIEYFIPRLDEVTNFWNKFSSIKYCSLVITESHADLFHLISKSFNYKNSVNVWNVDAHNDLGYSDKTGQTLNCGNWGGLLIDNKVIKSFTQIYPKWRNESLSKEVVPKRFRKFISITDNISDIFDIEFDIVFICRSDSWTPSWSDDEWIKFINWWEPTIPWKRKLCTEKVLINREFNLFLANKINDLKFKK